MGREAGPFVMAVRRTQIGLEQVGAGLGRASPGSDPPWRSQWWGQSATGGLGRLEGRSRHGAPAGRHRGRKWVEDLLCTTASRREWEARRSRAERRTADAMTGAAKDPEPLRVGSRGRHDTAREAQPSQRTIGGLAQPLRPPAPCSRRSAQGSRPVRSPSSQGRGAYGGQSPRTSVRDSWIRLAAFLREDMIARIGIDFGGVIIRNLHEDTGEDTSFRSSSGEQVARDGAFDAIRHLCSACDGNV